MARPSAADPGESSPEVSWVEPRVKSSTALGEAAGSARLCLDHRTWVTTVSATPGINTLMAVAGSDPISFTSMNAPVISIAQASAPETIPLCQGDRMISTDHKGHAMDTGVIGHPKTKAGMRNQFW